MHSCGQGAIIASGCQGCHPRVAVCGACLHTSAFAKKERLPARPAQPAQAPLLPANLALALQPW